MKTPVHFTCGHVVEIQLFGELDAIEAQKQYMEAECICPTCLANKFGGFPMILFEKALEHTGKLNLPNLVGSFDQIKEALPLRSQIFFMPNEWLWKVFSQEAHALQQTKTFARRFSTFDCSEGLYKLEPWLKEFDFQHMWQFFYTEACCMKDAAWWIDRDEQCARELANANLRRTLIGYNQGREDSEVQSEQVRKMIITDKNADSDAQSERVKKMILTAENLHEDVKQRLSYPNSDILTSSKERELHQSNNRKHPVSKKQQRRRK